MGCRRLDEIAQHIVVLDLQALNAGLSDVISLHAGNHAAPLVAQLPRFIQLCIESRGDKASVPHQQRRLRHQRLLQKPAQHLVPHKRRRRGREERRHADDEHLRHPQRARKPRADRRQVARPASVQGQA